MKPYECPNCGSTCKEKPGYPKSYEQEVSWKNTKRTYHEHHYICQNPKCAMEWQTDTQDRSLHVLTEKGWSLVEQCNDKKRRNKYEM